jgi:transposase
VKHCDPTTDVAGIDIAKKRLDVVVHKTGETFAVGNDEAGLAELIARLRAADVVRVGFEASGGFERSLRAALETQDFEIVMHQPLEVRLFARLFRTKAKNDRIDARTIAAATARVDTLKAARDPLLAEMAERLSLYEHLADRLAELKIFRSSLTLADACAIAEEEIARLQRLKRMFVADLVARLRQRPDLARRHQLLMSLPGVGAIVALALVVRMPELGALERGQAASLIGLAPFDRDSGAHKGQRFISGGRARPRRFVYLAALQARRRTDFKAFADRLAGAGKKPKQVIIAVARKLIEAANLILAQDREWIPLRA